ncbi:CU044_2847 family protein [Kitasatospora sp. NPDC059673]|uniref:CU044_2847 family protein n=1 Tax=Kitasatospora sp. NPDC059673 TaxID=3346901 RepID=UPI00368EBFCE
MYLSVPFESGKEILVELPEGQGTGVLRASRGDALVESSTETFESGLGRVRHVAEALLERLADLPRSPERIRAEFGIRLTAEAGLVVAKGTGDAHFVLELEWSRPDAQE